MYLLILCVVQLWLYFRVFLTRWPFWSFSLSGIYVLFFYVLDDSNHTGSRTWTAFRRWKIWQRFNAVQYYVANYNSFRNVQKKCGMLRQQPRMLFVVSPDVTHMSLISGFALHGGYWEPNLRLLCLLPDVFFCIPILREILLWCGCVAERKDKDLNGHVLQLLQRGHSVVMSFPDESSVAQDIFEFACKQNVFVVPVWVSKEKQRYWIWESPWVKRVQHFCAHYTMLRYPFPLFFFPRIFDSQPPPRLEINIGVPMNPDVHAKNYTEFNTQFRRQICDMGGPELLDP